MRWLLDTSVLIDHLRGHEDCSEWLTENVERGASLFGLTVVRTELIAGMRPQESTATFALLSAIDWYDVTVPIADRAGTLARKYLRSHPGIDTVDYLLAAAAQELDAKLATRNVKHYPMFKGLKAPY